MILRNSLIAVFAFFMITVFQFSSCKVSYKMNDVSIPKDIHTAWVQFIENKARYQNPLLSPELTERLRQKILRQTRLTQVDNSSADLIITPTITDYTFSTSGISNQQEATNRLSITVHVVVNDQKSPKTKEYNVTRSFEFAASLSIPQAEAQLKDEILRNVTDEIFNQMFSDW